MKRIVCLALLLLAVPLHVELAPPVQHVSVAELHREVRAGWHEVYAVSERDIRIDVDVQVPDVVALPVLRLSVGEGEAVGLKSAPREVQTLPTENGALSAEGAARIVQQALGGAVEGIFAAGIAQTTCADDVMAYELNLRQTFHGVPLLPARYYFADWLGDGQEMCTMPVCGIRATVCAADDWQMEGQLLHEVALLCKDVPLLPFHQIKPVIERWIGDGKVTELYEVSLGYMLFEDGEGEGYLALPVWNIRGDFYGITQEEKESALEDSAYGALRINAQTGEVFEPVREDAKRHQAPDMVTWAALKASS